MLNSEPLSVTAAVQRVEANATTLVTAAVHNLYALHPELRDKHGPRGVQACFDDSIHHLNFLIAAVQNGSPSSYVDYVRWVASVLQARHVADGLAELLELIGQQIRSVHGEVVWGYFQPTLDAALVALQANPVTDNEPLAPPPGVLMRGYLQALLKGDRIRAQALVLGAFQAGTPLQEIYLDVFQPSLYEVGRLWQVGQVSVAKEHLATAITQTILAALYAQMPLKAAQSKHAIVACLSSNYHEIGPRMLADFLQLAGYETLFLGANTPEESFLSLVDEQRPDLIGLPASLDLHVERVRGTIDILRSDFASYRPVIMVGGQAFNRVEGLWKQVGADVWGEDARQALNNLEGAKGH